ncbi:hypothetical protein GGE68_001397 [Rhizobium leguminosarum]|uniref:hypothetical protein n=1 Tax=Rhizobium leguminosarum TaxID=384 RepID=UPI0016160031|nr:hypothetical protein [Rhizobium leguminosarum]MBB5663221.1 hypothetical protein [Rhizobium leguminosarum]
MSPTKTTPGPWFVSGVRIKMDRQEWHGIARYNEDKKQDETIACVGFDPRTGLGLADAKLIAAAPELHAAARKIAAEVGGLKAFEADIRAVIGNTNWSVLLRRLKDVDDAIAKAEGGAA